MATKSDTKRKNIVTDTQHGYDYEAEFIAMGQLLGGYPELTYQMATDQGINENDWGEGDHAILWQAVSSLHKHSHHVFAFTVKEVIETSGEKLTRPELIDTYCEAPASNDPNEALIALQTIKSWTLTRQAHQDAATATRNLYSANGNRPEVAIHEAERLNKALTAIAADSLSELDIELLRLPADDHGNAQAINLVYPEFLHTSELGWLRYDGAKWESRLAEKQLVQGAVKVIRRRHQLAKMGNNKDVVTATKANSRNVKNAITMLADAIAFDSLDNFDTETNLLNCRNGVVNLKTGDLVPHSKEQRFTYVVPVDYDPKADYSDWSGWLWETLTPASQGDANGHYQNLADWLQMAIGYSLTGETLEQCMFYVYGPTRAGKGTFLQIISSLLGSRLVAGVDASTLTDKRGGDSQNFDLAPLRQSRMITVSETERRGRLNDRMVKAMTGDDEVRCAFKFGTPFSYTPQFKIWVTSNFEVAADPIDTALWGRLRIVEFPNSHLGNEDKTLKRRLLADLPAVLNWAIQGAVKWYDLIENSQGLEVPEVMLTEVEKHRAANDSVAQFIDDMCWVNLTEPDKSTTPVKALRPAYAQWCKDNEIKHIYGARSFNQSMASKGFYRKLKKHQGETEQCWFGTSLK